MSSIHYFQRYSQQENVATNNTLLLLSRFYQEKPVYFQRILANLEIDDIEVGPIFTQQRHAVDSIPDAQIRQRDFQIVVEVKKWDWLNSDQLKRHLKAFSEKKSGQYLIAIVNDITPERRDYIENELGSEINAIFKCVTFKQIADAARDAASGNSLLEEIADEYGSYCEDSNLYPPSRSILKVFAANDTLPLNLIHKMYYRAEGSSHFLNGAHYIGMYKHKSIRAIGKVRGYIDGVYSEDLAKEKGDGWIMTGSLSGDQSARKAVMDMAKDNEDIHDTQWYMCRYLFVDEFYETDIPKVSPGGIMGPRVFDLLNNPYLKGVTAQMIHAPSAKDIAQVLNGQTWY